VALVEDEPAARRAADPWRAPLRAAVLILLVLGGCTSLSTTTKCSTVGACTARGSKRLDQAILVPAGATFVEGAIKGGVLDIEFRDPPTGRTYSLLVGHPGSSKPACPGTVVALSPIKRFCYGRSATALLAQFTTGKLLYTISVGAPPGSTGGVGAPTASDEGVVTRIVSSMQ